MANQPQTITIRVSIPGDLKSHVEGKVSSGAYASASEFVREAIREKLSRDEEGASNDEAIDEKLLEGLNSGTPREFHRDFFAPAKKELAARIRRGASKRS